MKRFQVMAAVLAVGVLFSACSQAPAEVKGGLGPQFGTSRDDSTSVVTTDAQRGRIYLGGNSYDNYVSQNSVVFFRRYNRDGSLVWKVNANTVKPNIGASVTDVVTDPAGNVYFSWNTYRSDDGAADTGFISKYSPTGVQLFQKRLSHESLQGLANDTSGNLYVTSRSNHVRKYSSKGSLIWDKVLTEKDFQGDFVSIFDIEASVDGSLYVGAAYEGDRGGLLLKLREGDGKLVKTIDTKGDAVLEVKVSGSSVYAYSYTDGICYDPIVSKFRADGSEVWSRSGVLEEVDGGNGYRCDDSSSLGVDAQGNAYLTGYFIDENYDADLYLRKYTPSGKTAFNERFRSSATYAYGSGVATIGEDEIYVIGSTDGKANGNSNGKRDAFLFRLNAKGQKVWRR